MAYNIVSQNENGILAGLISAFICSSHLWIYGKICVTISSVVGMFALLARIMF